MAKCLEIKIFIQGWQGNITQSCGPGESNIQYERLPTNKGTLQGVKLYDAKKSGGGTRKMDPRFMR